MDRPLILIVDPDRDARTILRAYLEHHGYRVEDTGDGQRGLDLAASLEPHLVLGDFPMDVPGRSPFVRALREEVGCEAAVLVLTARASRAQLEAARAVGQGVLTKPVAPREVLAAVVRLLGPG